jgi:hypothetical protein
MSVMDTLVTDRQGGAVYSLTEDVNRVGEALNYVRDRLVSAAGYDLLTWTAKTDWTAADEPTSSRMAEYLSHLSACRAAMAVTLEAPATMSRLTVSAANNIEKILQQCDDALDRLVKSWYYCGETYSGEV